MIREPLAELSTAGLADIDGDPPVVGAEGLRVWALFGNRSTQGARA